MKRKCGFAWLMLAVAVLLLPGWRAQAGTWQVSIKSSGNGCVTYYNGNNPIDTYASSWHDVAMPPFMVGLACLNPNQCTSASAVVYETFTITLTWTDAHGAPPPSHLNYLLAGRFFWLGLPLLIEPAPDALNGSQCYTDDGLNDPYVGVALPPNNAEGASQGTHLYRVDNPGSTIVKTVSMTIDCTWPAASFGFDTNFGNSISVCLLDDLDPFPDNLAKSDPVVLYHGTYLAQANFLAADSTDIAALGGVDFWAGFYTMDGTAFDMAKFFAERSRDYNNAPWWGVAEFDVPLTMMLDFFCQYQDIILGYKDATRLDALASWNSPAFPNDVPDSNFTPNQNPANVPIPNGQMNWTNFCWYNYWYDLCRLGNPAPTGVGTDNYVPDWSIQANHYDWGYAMISGNFYKGPNPDCNDYRRGNLFTGRLGQAYQYVWCENGGVDLFNVRDANGKPLVKRSVIKQPGAP